MSDNVITVKYGLLEGDQTSAAKNCNVIRLLTQSARRTYSVLLEDKFCLLASCM